MRIYQLLALICRPSFLSFAPQRKAPAARPSSQTGTRSPTPEAAAAVQDATGAVRVLIVDDQALVRTGFRMILDAEADMEVVGEAANGNEALTQAGRLEAGRRADGRADAGARRDRGDAAPARATEGPIRRS